MQQVQNEPVENFYFQKFLYWSIFLHLLSFTIMSLCSRKPMQPDEHFQILEFLYYKFINGTHVELPWEYHEQMRPWLQIYFYELIRKVLVFFNLESPYIWGFTFRFVTALVGILGSYVLGKACFQPQKNLISVDSSYFYRALFHLLSAIFYWQAYFSARHSSEALSFHLFSLGWGLFLLYRQKSKFLSIFGLSILALSVQIRFQMILFYIPLALWAIFTASEKRKLTLYLIFILIAETLLCSMLDNSSYNNFSSFTALNYLNNNIFKGIANEFGTQPVSYYLNVLLAEPFGIIFIAAFSIFLYFYPTHWLTSVFVSYFFVHCIIQHKELRFLVPLILLLPYALVFLYQEKFHFLRPSWKNFIKNKYVITSALCLLLLSYTLKVSKEMSYYEYFRVRVSSYLPKTAVIMDYDGDPYKPPIIQNHGKGGVIKNNFYLHNSISIETAKVDKPNPDQDQYWTFREFTYGKKHYHSRLAFYKDCQIEFRVPSMILPDWFTDFILSSDQHFYLFKCHPRPN